jgi:hypothetical protein
LQLFVPGHDTFSADGVGRYEKSRGDAILREDRTSMLVVVQVAIIEGYDNRSCRPDSTVLTAVKKFTQRYRPVMLPQVANYGPKSLFADCNPIFRYIVVDPVKEEYRCGQGLPRGPHFVAQPLNP